MTKRAKIFEKVHRFFFVLNNSSNL